MIFFFDLIAPDRRVEAICPVDERTVNDVGEYFHAIPDYVLVRLLSELADKKGNKIVRFCSPPFLFLLMGSHCRL
jgi:hypothetical protein